MATEETILRRPKFDLRFVTEESDYQIKYDTARPDNNFMTESIISITTKNSMEDDVAAFSFVLAGDMAWDKLLHENDMVILNIEPNEYSPNDPFKKDRPVNRTAILGLVTEVRIEGSYDNNTKMYRITGQSYQKAFVNFELRSIRQAGHATTGDIGWLDWVGEGEDNFVYQVHEKTAAETAKVVIKRFRKYMKYNFVDVSDEKQKFDDFMKNQIIYDISSWEDDEYLQDPIPITSFEGTLNEFIKDIAAAPLLEYFFDVRPYSKGYEKAVMVIRRTPFDKKDWENLKTYVLRTRDVLNENFGRNDLDAYSIYNVAPEMENEDLALFNAVPWYSKKMIDKYGYKMLEVTNKFITQGSDYEPGKEPPSEGSKDDIYENTTAARFGKKMYEWYVNNPNFYSGDITVVGHPDYRIGNRLVYKNSKNNEMWEFYIESVEHSFSFDEGYTTNLGVTRGLRVANEKDHGIRFKPPAGKPKKFRGGYLGEMSLAEAEEIRKAREAEMNEGGEFDPNQSVNVGAAGFVRPANGVVTSPYGNRLHPKHHVWKMHNGIDIAGTDTDIYATAGGIVVTSGTHNGFGNYVEVHHGAINGVKNVVSLYAHMSKRLVKSGDRVMAGNKIGIQGETGTATGVHLHFSIKESGEYVDPNKYITIK